MMMMNWIFKEGGKQSEDEEISAGKWVAIMGMGAGLLSRGEPWGAMRVGGGLFLETLGICTWRGSCSQPDTMVLHFSNLGNIFIINASYCFLNLNFILQKLPSNYSLFISYSTQHYRCGE